MQQRRHAPDTVVVVVAGTLSPGTRHASSVRANAFEDAGRTFIVAFCTLKVPKLLEDLFGHGNAIAKNEIVKPIRIRGQGRRPAGP